MSKKLYSQLVLYATGDPCQERSAVLWWLFTTMMFRGMASIAALALLGAGAAETAEFASERGNELLFENRRLQVRLDRASGRWLALSGRGPETAILRDAGAQPSVRLTVDGRTVMKGRARTLADARSAGAGAKLAAWREERSGGAVWLVVDTVDGGWTIQHRYGFEPDGDTLERRLRLTWRGDRETLLRSVELRVPALADLAGAVLEAPGCPGVLHQSLAALPAGRWPQLGSLGPDSRPGLAIVQRANTNLLLWGYDEAIPSRIHVQRGDSGVFFSQDLLAATRVRPGQTIDVGTQYLRWRPGSLPEVLEGFRDFWNRVSLRRRGPTPAWAERARVYEVVLGAKGFAGGVKHEPYPAIENLIDDVPRIAGLGFNAIELMPRFPWPNYRVVDYDDVGVHYAPERDLRRMVERAHQLGLRVLLDVVMHGVIAEKVEPFAPWDRHPWLAAHPGWFGRTEAGEFAKTYTWSFDLASPAFQDHMVRVYADYVRRLDVDGFRADAITWNFFPNWATGLDRPGYASYFGAKPLLERAREAARRVKPDVVFYTETQGPLFNTSFDLTYSYDEHWLYQALLPLRSTRGYNGLGPALPRPMNARETAEWFDLRRRALPPETLRVHHADSHDSHEWSGLHMFKKEAFGVEAARLMFAFSAFLDGGVMNFAGAEAGSEDFYRKTLALVGATPALGAGASCDYLAIASTSDRVLPLLRRRGQDWAIPVLSFSAEPVEAELSLAALRLRPRATYHLQEAFTGARIQGKGAALARLKLKLPAYGVQLWTLAR
jgi:hypothetical protein